MPVKSCLSRWPTWRRACRYAGRVIAVLKRGRVGRQQDGGVSASKADGRTRNNRGGSGGPRGRPELSSRDCLTAPL
jgi:hypothetical protein